MKADLKQMSRKQLEKLRADVDAAIQAIEQKEKKAALKAAEAAAKAYGFSLEQLTAKTQAEKAAPRSPRARRNGDGRAKVAPKYRNPNNPEETWSGRGRPPNWVVAHIQAGGNKDDLAI